jgi:hypothetical protein
MRITRMTNGEKNLNAQRAKERGALFYFTSARATPSERNEMALVTKYSDAFNTTGAVRVAIRRNAGVGVAAGVDVCVCLAFGLSDGVASTVVVGAGVGPGVAVVASTP